MFDRSTFSSELAYCTCRNKQSDPFFFPIRQQRVMLLTACPSLQTVSGSLLTVRFVRQMLYALLGEQGVSDEGLSLLFSKKGIYWTHYNKCYCEQFYHRSRHDGTYLLEALPAECAARYFERELELLSKSLKLIIVMGRQTCRSAAAYIDAFRSAKGDAEKQIEVLEIDYLQSEDPAKYDELRKKVAAALGRNEPTGHADPSMLDTSKTRMRVGFDIELAALEAMVTASEGSSSDTSDDALVSSKLDKMWMDNVILPQKMRQSILLSAWSSIESAITTFFADALDPVSRKSLDIKSMEWLRETVSNRRDGTTLGLKPDFRDFLWTISNSDVISMMNQFMAHLTFGNVPGRLKLSSQMQSDWKSLSGSLWMLKMLRNILIHRGGFIATAELDREDPPANASSIHNNNYYQFDERLARSEFDLSGISVLTNTLFLSADAPEQILYLTRELFRFIVRLDEHLNKI